MLSVELLVMLTWGILKNHGDYLHHGKRRSWSCLATPTPVEMQEVPWQGRGESGRTLSALATPGRLGHAPSIIRIERCVMTRRKADGEAAVDPAAYGGRESGSHSENGGKA